MGREVLNSKPMSASSVRLSEPTPSAEEEEQRNRSLCTNDVAGLRPRPLPSELGVKASEKGEKVAKRKAEKINWWRKNGKKIEEWIIVRRCGRGS